MTTAFKKIQFNLYHLKQFRHASFLIKKMILYTLMLVFLFVKFDNWNMIIIVKSDMERNSLK